MSGGVLYTSPDRSCPDIDLDFNPMKKEALMKAFKKEFGENNVINCATFGTLSAKSAVITAVRALGIDVEVGQYLSSLIPVERGVVYPLKDVLYGRTTEDGVRKPVKPFIEEIEKYPGLKELALRISGLRDRVGAHASALYIFNNGYTDMNACMKTSSGILITQFSMKDSDELGALKMDMLFTEIQSKLQMALEMMIEDGVLEDKGSLKDNYDTYLHPDVIEMDNQDMWKTAHTGEIQNFFQLDSAVGNKAVRSLQPTNVYELTSTNALMRIMGEGISPIDKYLEFKNNPQLWENELNKYKITGEAREAIKEILAPAYGVASMQEEMMVLLMDERLCGFSVVEGNTARRAVAKKKADVMDKVKEMVYQKAKNENIAEYIWHEVVLAQAG